MGKGLSKTGKVWISITDISERSIASGKSWSRCPTPETSVSFLLFHLCFLCDGRILRQVLPSLPYSPGSSPGEEKQFFFSDGSHTSPRICSELTSLLNVHLLGNHSGWGDWMLSLPLTYSHTLFLSTWAKEGAFSRQETKVLFLGKKVLFVGWPLKWN